jgi:hypothetical protein
MLSSIRPFDTSHLGEEGAVGQSEVISAHPVFHFKEVYNEGFKS